MSVTLIKNCTLVPMTPGWEGKEKPYFTGDLAFKGDTITYVGPSYPADPPVDTLVEGEGLVAIPGLINCHTHAAMTLLRGYADDLALQPWLTDKIWPAEDRLRPDDVYWGTQLAIWEMLASGTTTFADMYFHMAEVARAVAEAGIRADLSRGLIGLQDQEGKALAEAIQLVEDWHWQGGGRLTVRLGPHAPYTCPGDYLRRVKAQADQLGVGLHIHLSETRKEVMDITGEFGKSPVQLLDELEILAPSTLAAHCVHVNQQDMDILAQTGTGVAHNPQSNMKLASGIAPVAAMVERGIKVGLGTDGAASNNDLDLVQEARSAALLQKVNTGDPQVLPAYQALYLATRGGAEALGMAGRIGSLQPGLKADLVLLDFRQPHLLPLHDVMAHLVYASTGRDVVQVYVDGKLVYRDGAPLQLDTRRIMQEVSQRSRYLIS